MCHSNNYWPMTQRIAHCQRSRSTSIVIGTKWTWWIYWKRFDLNCKTAKFYTDIYTEIIYSRAGYDVTSYFQHTDSSATVWRKVLLLTHGMSNSTAKLSSTAFHLTPPNCHHEFQIWRHQLLPVGIYRCLKKTTENSASTALGRIYPERFKRGSRNCTHLSGTVSLIYLLDMTWLAASSRLQNAFKYCTKVRKTGAVGNEGNV